MIFLIKNSRTNLFSRVILPLVIGTFLTSFVVSPQQTYAQAVLSLPSPGTMLLSSPAYVPAIVKGMTLYPDDPLRFDFIIDSGEENLQGEAFEQEARKLIKYFFASLTIPEEDLWVNLSPYEKDRIIPEIFGQTEMGRDLLAQDYILKQLTASLIYPENDLGKEFWRRVRAKAKSLYGTTDIPMNTFNKVWIVPEKAVVYENGNSVFIVDRRLKVMLEEDYLALQNNLVNTRHGMAQMKEEKAEVLSGISSEIVREVVIPEIEKEVNQGKNFANLRQIYNSMLLATWYKKNLRESLLGQVYVDQNNIQGVGVVDKDVKERIYRQYIEAFRRGAYNYIKEDYDQASKQTIPRKYFSGGAAGYVEAQVQARTGQSAQQPPEVVFAVLKTFGDSRKVTVDVAGESGDRAMMTEVDRSKSLPIKILMADKPANDSMVDDIRLIGESFGDRVRVIEQGGIGSNEDGLRAIIEKERPEVVMIRFQTKAFKEAEFVRFARRSGVRVIIRAGVGYDHINVRAAHESRISVIRSHGNANSVANFGLRYLLAALDNRSTDVSLSDVAENELFSSVFDIPFQEYVEAHYSVGQEGRGSMLAKQYSRVFRPVSAQRAAEILKNLQGKTIGIVGFGVIGQTTAQKLQRLKEITGASFDVMATSPSLDKGEEKRTKVADELGVLYPGEDALLQQADVLLFHLDGSERNYFDLKRLNKIKAKIIINLARHHVMESSALEKFLSEEGFYYGDTELRVEGRPIEALAALLEQYPESFYITPHMSASTHTARRQVELNTLAALKGTLEIMLGQEPSTNFKLDIVNDVPVVRIVPATPQRVIRGLASILNSYQWYLTEINQGHGTISTVIREIFEYEIEFRKLILAGIRAGNDIDDFIAQATRGQKTSIALSWVLFNRIWQGLLKREKRLDRQDLRSARQIEEQIKTVLADPQARGEWEQSLSQRIAETEPDRYLETDLVLRRLLDRDGNDNPRSLDVGVSTGVTTERLQARIGGVVIGTDLLEAPFAPVSPYMLIQGLIKQPAVIPSDRVQIWRGEKHDFTTRFYDELQGRIDVLRHAAMLLSPSDADFHHLVSDAFRYAKGKAGGVLYHQAPSTKTSPRLFNQFVYRITGPRPVDWEPLYIGYLTQNMGKDRSLRFSDDELVAAELRFSNRVLEAYGLLVQRARASAVESENVFDEYGRISEDLRERLITEIFTESDDSEETNILRQMLHDVSIISPWTREYTGSFYEDQHVYARHELAWSFVKEKRDVEELLDKLVQLVRDTESLSGLRDQAMAGKEATAYLIQAVPFVEESPAFSGNPVVRPPGGIDLDSVTLDIERRGSATTIPVPAFRQPMPNLQIEGGLFFNIINIGPANIPMILGISNQDPSEKFESLGYHLRLQSFDQKERL